MVFRECPAAYGHKLREENEMNRSSVVSPLDGTVSDLLLYAFEIGCDDRSLDRGFGWRCAPLVSGQAKT